MLFKDDGVGISEDVDLTTLGLTIANALMDQLGGTSGMSRSDGCEVHITSPAWLAHF